MSGSFNSGFGIYNGNLPKRKFKQVTVITKSGVSPVFGYPHGCCTTPYGFMIGTRTDPAKLILFTNENDLTQYVEKTVTGLRTIDTMVYDSTHDVCYALANTYLTTSTLRLLQINPQTLDYTTVYTNSSLTVGTSPTICTDGVYVYGGTYGGTGKIFKIKIEDWTLESTVTTGDSGFHASIVYQYTDRTEMYITNSTENAMYKVNCLDLSYLKLSLPRLGLTPDDIVFRYVDNTGGYLYVPSETKSIIAQINTATMEAEYFPAFNSYGVFSDGTDLYSVGVKIIKFPAFDLNNRIVNTLVDAAYIWPNEMFFGSSGKLFYTRWMYPSELTEFQITI